MPGINDTYAALESVAKRAKAVDANFLGANPLFLKSCSKGTFLEFVHQHFPQLEASYEKRYAEHAFVSKAYQKRIADLVALVGQKYGLGRRRGDLEPGRDLYAAVSQPSQQLLWPAPAKQSLPAQPPTLRRRFSA